MMERIGGLLINRPPCTCISRECGRLTSLVMIVLRLRVTVRPENALQESQRLGRIPMW